MKKVLFVLVLLSVGCKKETDLTSTEQEYVRTTLSLSHIRAAAKTPVDSVSFNREVDSIYKSHHTTKAAYIKATESMGKDPKRAEFVYNAVRDSMGIK